MGLIQSARLYRVLGVGLVLALLLRSVEYSTGAVLFLAFSFLFNDWRDAEKDAVGHPTRAIPSGKITRRQALYSAGILLIAGLFHVKVFLDEFLEGFILIYVLSIIYSYFLKPNIPILGTPVWSLAVAILFVQPFTNDPRVYILVTLMVFSYETILDYRDRVSDKVFCKTPTLVNLLGKYSIFLAALIFCSSLVYFQAFYLDYP